MVIAKLPHNSTQNCAYYVFLFSESWDMPGMMRRTTLLSVGNFDAATLFMVSTSSLTGLWKFSAVVPYPWSPTSIVLVNFQSHCLKVSKYRVWHGYGSHHGIRVMGVTGMGAVSKIQTWGHTVTCHHGVTGFQQVTSLISFKWCSSQNLCHNDSHVLLYQQPPQTQSQQLHWRPQQQWTQQQ